MSTCDFARPPEAAEAVLDRVSAELLSAARLIDGAQEVVSRVLATKTISSGDIENYQRLDEAVQRIEAVSQFIGRLSSQIPGHILLDAGTAASSLLLHDTARRLGGGMQAPEPADHGDVVMF